MRKWLFLLAIIAGGVAVGSTPVKAVGGLNLVISPLPINLTTEPGGVVSAQLKVKNGGIEPEELKIGLMKFSAFGEEGKPRLMDREVGDYYFDWISFSENEFTLNPNEWKTITATINVPMEAAFGYYYAVTFSRKETEAGGEAQKATKIEGATAILVLLEVRVPQAVREIEVLEFSSTKKIYEFLSTEFNIKLKNKGNVHVQPRGNIFIDKGNKKDVAILTVNDVKGNVLPDTNRIFDAKWSDGFPVYKEIVENNQIKTDKNGNPVKSLVWDFSQITKLRIGKFTASLLLVYDDGERDIPIEGKLQFWVIPWRILAGAILVMLIMSAGIYAVVVLPIVRLRKALKDKNLPQESRGITIKKNW